MAEDESVPMDPRLEEARQVLRNYWGYEDFRPGQDQAVANVLSGKDSLTIMPTGGGKSLCYQVPAMMLPGITLVVSPLISLMKDQVDTLDARGLPATFINSTLSGSEMAARLNAAERGEYRLLYVAPERFDAESFQERLARLEVSLLAVDEAHCVSEWGHDFRPSYLRLGRVRGTLGNPPIAALTATATEEVRRDIVRQLELRDAHVLVTGFDRRNLHWHVLRAKNDSEKDRLLLRLLRGREGSAIVYASTRKSVDALTDLLNGVGVSAVGYHAGIGDAERKRIQEEFMSGEVPVVVATNAFGMGIDKPDVRIVAHYNMPGNLEAYYQEAGRAGRDGEDADCVLLHAYADRFTHEFFIDQANPPRDAVEEVMGALRRRADDGGLFDLPVQEFARTLSRAKGDRQVYSALRVLEDYGLVKQSPAGGGQSVRVRLIATPKRITAELEEEGRTAELQLLRRIWKAGGGKAAYRGVELEWGDLGPRGRVSPLLDGLQREGFVEWSTWNGEGVLVLDRATPVNRLPIDWRGLESKRKRDLRKLQKIQSYAYHEECRRGFVLRYFGDPAAMESCGACDNCLRGSGGGAVAAAAASPAGTAAGGRPEPRKKEGPPLNEAQERLYSELREVRREVAGRTGLPPYFVFAESALLEMAARCPATPEEILQIAGVGPKTLDKYGAPFLEVLRRHAPEREEWAVAPAPARRRAAQETPQGPADGAEAELYGRLKTLRSEMAKEANLPSYCVFPDRTLIELARRRPASEGELLEVPGVGPVKLEKYGEAFLEAIREAGG